MPFYLGLQAQSVQFSRPQKVPNNIDEFDMLGKTNEGVLVHKWGDRTNILEAYDKTDLSLRWSRDIPMGKKDNKIIKIIPYRSELIIIYTTRQKKETYLTLRKTKANLTRLSEDLVLDTLVRKLMGSQRSQYYSEVSKNKKFIGIFKKNYDFKGLKTIDCTLLNRDLEILGTTTVAIEDRISVKKSMIDNKGNIYIAKAKHKRNLFSNSPQYEQIELVTYNYQKEKNKSIYMEKGEHQLNDLEIEVDDLNNRVVIAGFYNDKQGNNNSNGYFYVFADLESYQLSQQTFTPFSKEFLDKIKNQQLMKSKKHVSNLNTDKLILRKDGGALLIGESYYTSNRYINRYTSLYTNNQTDRVTNYYHDDVIVLSINPDGSLLWNSILQKKQYSEADDGYFSSFGVVNTRRALNLIFNEEISARSKVSNFILGTDGKYKIASLINSKEFDLMIAPRYSKQLSANEVLIPGFDGRNQFLLTKVTFDAKK